MPKVYILSTNEAPECALADWLRRLAFFIWLIWSHSCARTPGPVPVPAREHPDVAI